MLKSRGDDKLLERGCRRTQLGTNVNLEVDLLSVQQQLVWRESCFPLTHYNLKIENSQLSSLSIF